MGRRPKQIHLPNDPAASLPGPADANFDDASVDLWAAKVLEDLRLPDARLKMRALDCLGALARKPTDSIPQACGNWAATKGLYRFLSNENVRVEALREAVCLSSVSLAAGRTVILAPQDSTSFSMSTAEATKGLGLVGKSDCLGYHLHSMLFLDIDGVPMGLAAQYTWVRETRLGLTPAQRKGTPIEDKESRKWFEMVAQVRAITQALLEHGQRPYLIHIFDREGDIHEIFANLRCHGEGFVIRSTHDRAARDLNGVVGRAHKIVGQIAPLGCHEILLPRKGKKPARRAVLELRSSPLRLAPRRRCAVETKYPKPPVDLTLVEAREVNCPEGEEAVRWLLWTSETASTLAECVAVLNTYCKRWKIEEYHLTLKSGCHMEDLRLKTLAALEKALVLYALVAVRILRLRDLGRLSPDAPCTEVLNDLEWRVLEAHATRKVPAATPPTIRQAVLWIGKLGGHLGRTGDGMPGVRVLWKGLRDLELLVDQAQLYLKHPNLLNPSP